MSKTKKKVIAIVVDTDLTNAQIEKASVFLEVKPKEGSGPKRLQARRVRVLDSD